MATERRTRLADAHLMTGNGRGRTQLDDCPHNDGEETDRPTISPAWTASLQHMRVILAGLPLCEGRVFWHHMPAEAHRDVEACSPVLHMRKITMKAPYEL